MAINVLEKYFEEFTKKHYEKIQRGLNLTDEQLREVINQIIKLNPKPAGTIGDTNKGESYVVPDFFIYNNAGKLELTLNSKNAPDLRIIILKNNAEDNNLDISTVSRVANSKFVQTEFGTYRLKFFFSESLQTDSGEEVSTREVKKILSDIIGSENKKHPYSDEKLTEMLQKKGYNIARRTVAKYREQL